MDETVSLDDLAWLRRLARTLVRDTATADDAVQDTLIAAGEARVTSRAWLARTLRNFVRQEHRSRARRSTRESATSSGRPSHAPAPDELLAELESHRMLADEVRALDEPYRETLLLRFVREWSPRRIAGHQGVPVKTVHTRIERGLARLRARLDRRAPRERWLSALAVMGEPRVPRFLPVAGLGATLMSVPAQWTLAAGIVAILGLPFLLSRSGDDGSGPSDAPVAVAPAITTQDAPLQGIERPTRSRSQSVDAPAVTHEIASERWIHGRVLDAAGAPVIGVQVAFHPKAVGRFSAPDEGASVSSDVEGRVRLQSIETAGRLDVVSDEWAAIHRPFFDPRLADRELTLVVSPRRSFAGRVVDESGSPVPGARVVVMLPGRFLHPLAIDDRVLAVRNPLAATTTDELGSFEMDAVGVLDGASLVASRDGFESARLSLPSETDLDLQLVLKTRDDGRRVIRGRVLTEVGTPATNALVSAGGDSITVGVEGDFALPVEPWRKSLALRAVDLDHGVAVERFTEPELDRALEGEPIELLLPGPPRSVRGRVVDESGAPLPGIRVWTPDTTWFGSAPVRGERSMTAVATTEALASGHPGPFPWVQATHSDARGEFELAGLASRSYDVFASNDATLVAVGPVSASPDGGELRIELTAAPTTRIAGVVIDGSGEPLSGVAVHVGRDLAWERPVRANDEWEGSPLRPPSATSGGVDVEQRTDDEGRFEFPALVLDDSWLTVRGDEAWLPQRLALDEVEDPAQIRMTVRTRAEFVIHCRSDADAFRLESAHDEMQPLLVPVEDAMLSTDRAAIVDGRSLRAFTGSGPVTVLLLRGDEVLERRDVVLERGLQTLDF
ncbi:MAG: sigma-70 family RNA polymerase sigma factor [Planctomycetota bacterium]